MYKYQRQLGLGLEDFFILLIYFDQTNDKLKYYACGPQYLHLTAVCSRLGSSQKNIYMCLWVCGRRTQLQVRLLSLKKKERDLKPIPSADAAMAEPEAEIPETPPSQPVETVPLSGSARLAEALQKRNAGSPALDCGAKPKAKAKGKPKAKPSLKRPAARSDVRPAKKPASASSSAGNLKKPKPKSQAKGSKSSKSTSAVKPKMTRTCVYSRA